MIKLFSSFRSFRSALRMASLAALCVLSVSVAAHNQSPATIKRSMEKAFKSLSAPNPANMLNGQKSLRVAGTTAQIFDAKIDNVLVGYVAQIEVAEQIYAISFDTNSRQIKGVVRAGTALGESEWKELEFVESIRKTLEANLTK